MNELKECKKCKTLKELSKFSSFIAMTINGLEKRIRKVCYECIYKNRRYTKFTWKNSSEREQLKHLEDNFNKYVIKQDGCWDWKGFVRPDGYTRMKFMNRTRSIGGHVVSWLIHNKTIKVPELFVLHKCDNRKCTNISHLYLGDARDNMIDMVTRGKRKNIKLNIPQVKKINILLKMKISVAEISRQFNVHRRTIADIRDKKTWKFIS